MTNKSIIGVCLLVAVVASLVTGLVVNSVGNGNFGSASVTASNALNQQRLINELTNLASPLQNIASFSGSFAIGTLNAVTPSTSTAISTPGALPGDAVIVTVGTATTTQLSTSGSYVSGPGTTTVAFNALVASSTATISLGSTPFRVLIIPSSTFIGVSGL